MQSASSQSKSFKVLFSNARLPLLTLITVSRVSTLGYLTRYLPVSPFPPTPATSPSFSSPYRPPPHHFHTTPFHDIPLLYRSSYPRPTMYSTSLPLARRHCGSPS